MQLLSLAIVLTSQGIPFLHAGTEFLRTKKGIENSFNAGDSINKIDWSLKSENIGVFNIVQTLIKLRKAHPAFRMATAAEIKKHIRFDENCPAGTIVYTINGAAVKDKWKTIFVAFNGTGEEKLISLPAGKWHNADDTFPPLNMSVRKLKMDQYSTVILYKE